MDNLVNQYKSGEILLQTSIKEYESEKNRTSVIDSKTNIVISLTAILFIAITEIVDLNKLLSVKSTYFATNLLTAILFLSIVSSIVFAFLALIFFLKVIFTKAYKSIDANYFYDTDKLKIDPQLFSIALSRFYIDAIVVNAKANDKRINYYKKGMSLLIVSVATFTLHVCLLSFL